MRYLHCFSPYTCFSAFLSYRILSTDTYTVDWWYSSLRPVRGPVARKFTGSTKIYGLYVDLRVARKSTTSPLPVGVAVPRRWFNWDNGHSVGGCSKLVNALTWWRHQMETFSALLAIWGGGGIRRSTKASDAELWCFLSSASESTVG